MMMEVVNLALSPVYQWIHFVQLILLLAHIPDQVGYLYMCTLLILTCMKYCFVAKLPIILK